MEICLKKQTGRDERSLHILNETLLTETQLDWWFWLNYRHRPDCRQYKDHDTIHLCFTNAVTPIIFNEYLQGNLHIDFKATPLTKFVIKLGCGWDVIDDFEMEDWHEWCETQETICKQNPEKFTLFDSQTESMSKITILHPKRLKNIYRFYYGKYACDGVEFICEFLDLNSVVQLLEKKEVLGLNALFLLKFREIRPYIFRNAFVEVYFQFYQKILKKLHERINKGYLAYYYKLDPDQSAV